MNDHADRARAIIDRGSYMTLATADSDGLPWASPVWYVTESYASFLWISSAKTRHSRNLEVRPQLGIVIFDSAAPFGVSDAVFFDATASPVPATELDDAVAVFSDSMMRRAGKAFERADLDASADARLYRASVTAAYIGAADHRLPVDLC